MEYKIEGFSEGVFELNESFSIPNGIETEVLLHMLPIIFYRQDSDIIGMQLTLLYRAKDTEILKYGYIASVKVNGWQQIVSEGNDVEFIANELKEAWKSVVNYGRGVIQTKLNSSKCKGLIIPDIPLEFLKKTLKVKKVD